MQPWGCLAELHHREKHKPAERRKFNCKDIAKKERREKFRDKEKGKRAESREQRKN